MEKKEGDETVTVNILESSSYTIGSPGTADMTIGDAELHVCQDDSIPYTHFEYRCATFWGCDGSGRFMKDNVICLSNSYQILIAGTLDVYTCAKPYFGDCSISYSETIYSREDNEDGSYTVYWNSGNTWMNVSPED